MKSLIFIILVTATIASGTIYEDVFKSEWNLYKAKYQKFYSSQAEENKRLDIFKESKYRLATNNEKYFKGEIDFLMGINQFSDMLPEEVNNMYNNRVLERDWDELDFEPFVASLEDPPQRVSWLEKGSVTPVRDQKSCGSCYAFAAIAALESHHHIKNKKLEVLSVQQIIDCSTKYGNYGCGGGLALYVYQYLMDVKTLNHESSYPYEAKDGPCRVNKTDISARVIGFVRPSPKNETDLMKAVALGPVSVSIDASHPSFHSYKSGIYYEPKCSSDRLGHAVVVVGYGTDKATKKDYWIVKNSWGTTWGDKGYIKMERNKNNMCGIATRPVFPKVA